MNTKITRHAIIQNKERFPIWISTSEDHATIYATRYRGFRELDFTVPLLKGLFITDNSDIMTDYFETPRIEVPSTHSLFPILQDIQKKSQLDDAQRKERKKIKREKELEKIENKIYLEGRWWNILEQTQENDFIRYKLKKINKLAKNHYAYRVSLDGKRHTRVYPLFTIC